MSAANARPAARLNALATVGQAYATALAEAADLARLAVPPVVAIALLAVGANLLGVPWTVGAPLIVVAQLALAVPFSVACLRDLLGAGEVGTVRAAYVWRPQHWLYLRAMALLGAFAALAALLSVGLLPESEAGDGLSALLGLALNLAALYLGARLSLMLPAAAVGEEAGLGRSWALTQGNGWRVLLVHLLAALPLAIAGMLARIGIELLLSALGIPFGATVRLVVALLSTGIAFAGLAVSALALGLIYRALRSGPA